MAKQLYDIQGVPIKVGSLVACPAGRGILHRGRVVKMEMWHEIWLVHVERDARPSLSRTPVSCVVLEEPLWPST